MLIANRGEIAVRIIRVCREMEIETVAVYSVADKEALHTQLADEAVCIGGASSEDSYLNMESIISAAVTHGADAIHPGFGFLSENPQFAKLCKQCNITYIGPDYTVIEKMGNKVAARQTMINAKIPVVPGTNNEIKDLNHALQEAEKTGYPVIVKAASGGGGKGIRVAYNKDELKSGFLAACKESMASFGDDTMYMEKFIENPRHIEFQILADNYGNVIHLGERDCSIQRHHQKILEEAPSVVLSENQRKEMGKMAVRAAKAAGYKNAGTVEFLLDKTGKYYFMEMNTRIQVEHPITESITGIDIVKEQILIAQGEKLKLKQNDIKLTGHAIECRINAEIPEKNFMPSPGTIVALHFPGGNGIRTDLAAFSGYTVPPYYDSMLAKLIVHGKDRNEAIKKMKSALGEVVIEGVHTNIDYAYDIINNKDYISGNFDINFLEHFNWNKG